VTASYVPFDEIEFPEPQTWPLTEEELRLAAMSNGRDQNVVPLPGPRVISLEDIEVKDIEWVDEGFVPASTLTVLQGHGGVGKGPWTCQLAARVTRGETADRRPGRVLFAVAEDDYASVLKPRLLAAGSEIRYVKGLEDVTLPEHIDWLEQQIVALGGIDDVPVRLLVVDPILTHLGGKIDSYKDHEVKLALRSLVALSAKNSLATIAVLHFTKDTARGARFSGQASGAFGNTARSVLSMAIHDEDDSVRLLEVSKSNFGQTGIGRRYRIELVAVDRLERPQVVLREDGEADKTVDAALKAIDSKGKTVDKRAIRELILRELHEGGKSLDDLKKLGRDELGTTDNAVYTVASELKDEGVVKPHKQGLDGGWLWELTPALELSGAKHADSEKGLNNEDSPEVSIHHVTQNSKAGTPGSVGDAESSAADGDRSTVNARHPAKHDRPRLGQHARSNPPPNHDRVSHSVSP
jgi:AAA domain